MGIGETTGVKTDKPKVHTDKDRSGGSEKAFNEALGKSGGSASSTQAAARTAPASGGKPTIVRIDAKYHSKSATATLSDGSKVPLRLTKNQLAPGDTLHILEYGAESGPEDAEVVELTSEKGANNSILWTQPSNYGLSPKVVVSIKQDPDESARRRLEKLPSYIQEHVKQVNGDGSLESQAKMGEDLVKSGAKKEDFAPVEIHSKAPADPDFKFVEAARKGRYSQFPSFDEFKKNLTRQVEAARDEARAKGLNPPDPFSGQEWKDNPAAAREKWDKFVHAQYDKALKNEAAGLKHVGEVASMAENAVWQGLGLSAVLGTGGAGLAALGEWAALPTVLETSTGVSSSTWLGTFGKYMLGISFGSNLINRTKEGIEAGSNPIAVVATAATDVVGGRALEKATNESNLTGKKLNLTPGERVLGGIVDLAEGAMNVIGLREAVKAPGVGEPSVPRGTSADPAGNATPTSTHKQLTAGSSGADDVAAIAGKGTATTGQTTASTVKPPAAGDAPATNTRTGATGDTTASNAAKPKAASGGDAADTVRMPKAGSGGASRPSDATNVSGSKTGETARGVADPGDTAKMRKAGGADAAKAESNASSAAAPAAKAGAGNAVPTRSVDQVVDAYTRGRSPAEIRNSVSEADIARMKAKYKADLIKNKQSPEVADQMSDAQYRRMAMADEIYGHYNKPVAGKPQPKITDAQLNSQLKKYDGPTEATDGWHVRMNKPAAGKSVDTSWVNADKAHPVDRFYVNVKAEHAPEFADYVAGELNKKGIDFQLKVASDIKGYARADSGVVYAKGKDFEAVRDVIAKYRDTHPEAIAEGAPAFTKPMGKGVSVAEEPLQEGLPVAWHGGHSFGTARTNLIAEAINQAPANASPAQVKILVRAKLEKAGFDADRPWLAQGSKVDRLNVGDHNVARSSAANGGVAFDNTMPQPAVQANPPAPPPGRGGAGGNNGASGGAGGGGSSGSSGTPASSADVADQAAARQHAEQVRNYKPNFKADPGQGGSVAIDSLLDDMQKGNLKVVDNAFNSKFHDQVWQDMTGKQGQAPAAYKIGGQARVDLNRLTPDQLQRYRAYVQKQDAAKGPH